MSLTDKQADSRRHRVPNDAFRKTPDPSLRKLIMTSDASACATEARAMEVRDIETFDALTAAAPRRSHKSASPVAVGRRVVEYERANLARTRRLRRPGRAAIY